MLNGELPQHTVTKKIARKAFLKAVQFILWKT